MAVCRLANEASKTIAISSDPGERYGRRERGWGTERQKPLSGATIAIRANNSRLTCQAFLNAYSFAKRLKTLNGLTRHEALSTH